MMINYILLAFVFSLHSGVYTFPHIIQEVMFEEGMCGPGVVDNIKLNRHQCIMNSTSEMVKNINNMCREEIFPQMDDLQFLNSVCTDCQKEKKFKKCMILNMPWHNTMDSNYNDDDDDMMLGSRMKRGVRETIIQTWIMTKCYVKYPATNFKTNR
ncbi:uncharacterized protein LOC143244031 [Tachypleus tridentatus]|uniref:uncharacterized protein LOC143244031 n=1 Tax=Tachypleus tridentatus TaxID=6853 RepID=UPI003FD14494